MSAHLAPGSVQKVERARTLGGIARYRERTGWKPGHCTWAPCRKEIAHNRLWCGPACVDLYRQANDTKYARAAVAARDHGVCSQCGTDTEATRVLLSALARHAVAAWCKPDNGGTWRSVGSPAARRASRAFHEALAKAGIPAKGQDPQRAVITWWPLPALWQADHAIEVAEGGGGCSLDNLVTLCVPCHAAKTKASATARRSRPTLPLYDVASANPRKLDGFPHPTSR